jgi:hypothetical protein
VDQIRARDNRQSYFLSVRCDRKTEVRSQQVRGTEMTTKTPNTIGDMIARVVIFFAIAGIFLHVLTSPPAQNQPTTTSTTGGIRTTYEEAKASDNNDIADSYKMRYVEHYLRKHPNDLDLVNKLDFSDPMFARDDYVRVVVPGTTVVAENGFWACPANAPDAPKSDYIERMTTQIQEKQCIDFKAGDHVLIHEYRRTGESCVTRVGSAKECQWTGVSFPIFRDMDDFEDKGATKAFHPKSKAIPGVWDCPGEPGDPSWCFAGLPVTPNENIMNAYLDHYKQYQNWAIFDDRSKGMCFIGPNDKVTVIERRAATSTINGEYIGTDGKPHACNGVVPNEWVHQ